MQAGVFEQKVGGLDAYRSTAIFDEAGAYCLSAGYRLGAVPRSLNGVEYEF